MWPNNPDTLSLIVSLVSLTGIIIASISAIIAYEALKELHIQRSIQQDEYINRNRPWISIVQVSYSVQNKDDIIIIIHLKNIGHRPADNAKLDLIFECTDGDHEDIFGREDPVDKIIFPAEDIIYRITSYKYPQLRKYLLNRNKVSITGLVKYKFMSIDYSLIIESFIYFNELTGKEISNARVVYRNMWYS